MDVWYCRANPRHLFPLIVIVLLGLLLTSPLLLTTCSGGHDIYHHLIFSHHFSSQLLQGELYPRWLLNMNGGFGSPTFFFYPPVPYYLTAIFSWLPEQSLLGCTPLGVSISTALILSGITTYYWCRELTRSASALGLALLYMVLPYHFLIDLYIRFSFAEFWSFAWMPLILYCSRRVNHGDRWAIPALALSLALLIGTHLPTFLIFLPILIGYSLLAVTTSFRLITCAQNGLGIVLGIGLSAVYWLPAMTTQEYVSMPSMYVGFMHYSNGFLSSWPTPERGWTFRRYLMVVTVGTCLLGILAWCWSRRYLESEIRNESGYWLVVAVLSLGMTLPWSKPIWDLLPMLQKVQFPWRFNAVLTIATITLFAFAATTLRALVLHGRGCLIRIWAMLLASLLMTQLLVGIEPLFFDRLAASDIQKALHTSRSPLEYRPRWVPLEQFSKEIISRLSVSTPQVHSEQSALQWQIISWAPRQIRLQISTPKASTLTLHQYYYPGWIAYRAGTRESLPLQPSREGLIQIRVPAGAYQLTVTLEPLPEELTGRWISGLALLATLLLAGYLRQPMQRAEQRGSLNNLKN